MPLKSVNFSNITSLYAWNLSKTEFTPDNRYINSLSFCLFFILIFISLVINADEANNGYTAVAATNTVFALPCCKTVVITH
jgi:hypothetical protein